ncbi:hypothetical protein [Winogradskyella helgolandensis]|uniref:hypothetical protein n=1 Tax=Winogradskyella helgolandensis TaxID=2697010 RepID=UPI0015BB8EDB|nr:hypothetical protein [Winogradskyella helgolandensis]
MKAIINILSIIHNLFVLIFKFFIIDCSINAKKIETIRPKKKKVPAKAIPPLLLMSK